MSYLTFTSCISVKLFFLVASSETAAKTTACDAIIDLRVNRRILGNEHGSTSATRKKQHIDSRLTTEMHTDARSLDNQCHREALVDRICDKVRDLNLSELLTLASDLGLGSNEPLNDTSPAPDCGHKLLLPPARPTDGNGRLSFAIPPLLASSNRWPPSSERLVNVLNNINAHLRALQAQKFGLQPSSSGAFLSSISAPVDTYGTCSHTLKAKTAARLTPSMTSESHYR